MLVLEKLRKQHVRSTAAERCWYHLGITAMLIDDLAIDSTTADAIAINRNPQNPR